MTVLSLRAAAKEAGTSKSTILRAIQSGRLSAHRNDDGGYDIDPAELFRVYPPKPRVETPERSAGHMAGRDTPADGPAEPDALAVERVTRIAALETEVRGLRDLLAEVKQSRDEWREQAARLTNAIPDLRANKAEPHDRCAPDQKAAGLEKPKQCTEASAGAAWWRRLGLVIHSRAA